MRRLPKPQTTTVSRRVRAAVTLLLAALLAGAIPASSTAAAAARPYELDGRRGREIVVAVPWRAEVAVIPGSATGAKAGRTQRLSMSDLGLHREDNYYHVPRAVGSGDVNGDGYADLVATSVSEDEDRGGAIGIVPGGPDGLRIGHAYRLELDDAQYLGQSLLVADLDRDGIDDVAATYWQPATTGVPVVSPGSETHPAVAIFWGSRDGVTSGTATRFAGPPAPESYGYVPVLIGAGNVEGDGRVELVVVQGGADRSYGEGGVPAGMQVCRIEPGRAMACGEVREVPRGITDMIVADVVGGGRDEVVLGRPDHGRRSAGALWVYRATTDGLAPGVVVQQNSRGVPGRNQRGDMFGGALAAADLDGDGKDDIAVGAPGEDDGTGRVTLLYGHRDGLGAGRAKVVDQDKPGVPGRDERGDRFGTAVSLIDVDGNGVADLVVGAPAEDAHDGAVTVVRSTRTGRLKLRSAAARIRAEDAGYSVDERGFGAGFGSPIGR